MKRALIVLGFIALPAVIFTAMHSFTSLQYFCSECAAERIDEDIRPFGLRSLGRIRGRVVATEITPRVTAVVGEPCDHRWVFAVGSGGSFV